MLKILCFKKILFLENKLKLVQKPQRILRDHSLEILNRMQ
ncbi:SLEI motif protein [Leptospira noguchii]|nr:SLEI motif protein [Leptospira noguchii]